MMAKVGVDACFLIGLYDESDSRHSISIQHFDALFGEKAARNQLVAPWPILYECCGTRQAMNPRKTDLLRHHWNYLQRNGRLVLLDDRTFREQPLEEHLTERSRQLSLVDRVLRAMIIDQHRPFDFFLTYNTGDFADACQSSGVYLLNENISAISYGI
jgi:predicted nucleic acid-binding protein